MGIGSAEGVFLGMELHLVEPDPSTFPRGIAAFEVEQVAEHSSKALLTQYEPPEEKKELPSPEVGWKLSTRPRPRNPEKP